MSEKDHAQLTLLATGGLTRRQAARLHHRIAGDPELASAWEQLQVLHTQLRERPLPANLPKPPRWQDSKDSEVPKKTMRFRLTPLHFVAGALIGLAVYTGISFVWVRQMKREELLREQVEKRAQVAVEHQMMTQVRNTMYSVEALPQITTTFPNIFKPYLFVKSHNRRVKVAWKLVGYASVVVKYRGLPIEYFETRLPENPQAWAALTERYPHFPQPNQLTPRIVWSQGAVALGQELPTTPKEPVHNHGVFVGWGRHQIRGARGEVVATLELHPLKPVEYAHDTQSSHRGAEGPVRP